MALWREGGFAADVWTHFADDAALPGEGAAILGLARWRREREALAKRPAPVGVKSALARMRWNT